MNSPRRKHKVTYNVPGHAHFLTYSCHKRMPLLSKDQSRAWVIRALREAREKLAFDLWAYVVMPEHVHLLMRPRHDPYRLPHILAALKRSVSAWAKAYLLEVGNKLWLDKLTIYEGKVAVFRFWQPGGGYDENLWQEHSILEVIEYIHANPVRRGLVEQPTDWTWSSARFWAGDFSGPLAMDSLLDVAHG